jgi:Family of unknown function (DUF6176)
MLRVVFSRVRDGQVDRLRAWMHELMSRSEEVGQTFAQEGVRHEVAYLLEAREGPVLVYAIELDDEDRARDAFEHSTLPIDLEHRRIMESALLGRGQAAVELLYECSSLDQG